MPLQEEEGDHENTKDHKERDDTSIAPGVLSTAPLKSQKKTDDGWQKDDCSSYIKLSQKLLPRCHLLVGFVGWKEKEDEEEGHGSNWQVDIKAPAPGDSIGESTSQTINQISSAISFLG